MPCWSWRYIDSSIGFGRFWFIFPESDTWCDVDRIDQSPTAGLAVLIDEVTKAETYGVRVKLC